MTTQKAKEILSGVRDSYARKVFNNMHDGRFKTVEDCMKSIEVIDVLNMSIEALERMEKDDEQRSGKHTD